MARMDGLNAGRIYFFVNFDRRCITTEPCPSVRRPRRSRGGMDHKKRMIRVISVDPRPIMPSRLRRSCDGQLG
jgi:hypothetical protein